MTEHFTDRARIDALRQEDRYGAVAQIMYAHLWDAGSLENSFLETAEHAPLIRWRAGA